MRERVLRLFSSALSRCLWTTPRGGSRRDGTQHSVLRISVRAAWLAHERYARQRVVVAGVVRAFAAGTPAEYFTLDDGPNRIGVRGDMASLRARVGRRVAATGVLTFKPGVGIFLDAEAIEED